MLKNNFKGSKGYITYRKTIEELLSTLWYIGVTEAPDIKDPKEFIVESYELIRNHRQKVQSWMFFTEDDMPDIGMSIRQGVNVHKMGTVAMARSMTGELCAAIIVGDDAIPVLNDNFTTPEAHVVKQMIGMVRYRSTYERNTH